MSLFGGNADIKYPLDEFHEEDFPNGLLLDLSLAFSEQFDPVLAAFRSAPGYAFLSIEDRGTGIPLACVIVQNPVLGRAYPMDMSVDGFGWVVFGPRATGAESFYSDQIEIGIDPEAVIPVVNRPDAVVFGGSLNGADLLIQNVLELATATDLLTLTVEGDTITIARNDEVLSDQERIALIDPESGLNASVILTIDGVIPDADGNIDIVIQGCAEPCLDTHSLRVPAGDSGSGTQTELPLDVFDPTPPIPGDPCEDSSASLTLPEELGEYDQCHGLADVPIKDRNNRGKEVGTVFLNPNDIPE
jgi:hypothetical protein